MRILVTGGAGFIGSNLCEYLIKKGHTVYCLDNFSSGRRKNLVSFEGVEVVQQDVTAPFDLRAEWIFHLASIASPARFERNALEIALTNSIGTLNVLRLAEKYGSRVLISSTSEVYGDPETHPQSEDYRGNVATMGPRAPYDESKRFAETLAYIFHTRGVDVRVARIFNTYGPRMTPGDGRVIPSFALQALTGRRLTVYGDGSQTRSFCYVTDMIEGLYALIASEREEVKGLPVNLGNPSEHRIVELAALVIRLAGSYSEIEFLPLPKDDPKRRRPDITRAREMLGWEPRTSLEKGLEYTLDYFRKEIAADST
jgi:UDP-glucuronate decarboxylase